MRIMKRYILYIALCLMAAVACEQLPDEVKIYGVGCYDPDNKLTALREKDLDVDAGEFVVGIYADGEYTATLSDEDSWIRFADQQAARTISGNGDSTIKLVYDINKGIPRTAVLTLQRGNNVFELKFTQYGILEGGVEFQQKNITVSAAGGHFGAKVITRVKPEDLTFEVSYEEESEVDWISNLELKNNFIGFDVKTNLSEVIRHAVIKVKYEGGAGYIQVCQFFDGCDTDNMEVDAFKGLLTSAGEFEIDSHIVLTGTVINDHEGMNGAENRLISAESMDREYSKRILYIQNAEGTDGVKLVFRTKTTDVVSRFDKISVDLYGATLKRENNPVRYTVTGIPVSSIIGTMAGDAVEPRDLALENLTDSDLYTLVNLTDIEIPVRKGSYAPIDIRQIGMMVSYPMVIRSKNGATSHMMVNVDCPWSRNGEELPEGSGSIAGVLVHEKCDNFEWDSAEQARLEGTGINANYITGLGTIGKYQIRPIAQDDVKLDGEPYSKLMYEWGYCDTLGVHLLNNYADQTLYPTRAEELDLLDADAQLNLTIEDLKATGAKLYCEKTVDGVSGKVLLLHCHDYSHLGPYTYGRNITDDTRGNGIVDYWGNSAFWRTDQGGEQYGVLYSQEAVRRWTEDNAATWCTNGWSENQYWCMEFPTADLTAANSPLTLTFGTLNSITKGAGAPRYWTVEWSADGTAWTKVQEYTVPDFVSSANRKVYQNSGIKYITVNLPDLMLGKDNVYVRLKPRNTKVGTSSSYDGGTKFVSSTYNGINYVAIRYNK